MLDGKETWKKPPPAVEPSTLPTDHFSSYYPMNKFVACRPQQLDEDYASPSMFTAREGLTSGSDPEYEYCCSDLTAAPDNPVIISDLSDGDKGPPATTQAEDTSLRTTIHKEICNAACACDWQSSLRGALHARAASNCSSLLDAYVPCDIDQQLATVEERDSDSAHSASAVDSSGKDTMVDSRGSTTASGSSSTAGLHRMHYGGTALLTRCSSQPSFVVDPRWPALSHEPVVFVCGWQTVECALAAILLLAVLSMHTLAYVAAQGRRDDA